MATTASTRKTATSATGTAKAPATKTTPAAQKPADAPEVTPAAEATLTPEATTTPDQGTGKAKKPNGAKDGLFGQLIASSKEVDTMPTTTRNGSSRVNPFAALVNESFVNDKPRELAPVEADDMDRVIAAIRRGAAKEGLGVNVVHAINEDGKAVITFKGKKKDVR